MDGKKKPGPTAPTEPIRGKWDIKRIKKSLADHPRNLALFVVGINTAFRASDLLNIRVGDVRGREVGDDFTLREKKTKNDRRVTINAACHEAIAALLQTMPDAQDDDFLFQSSGGRKVFRGNPLTVATLGRMVAKWCADAGLKGDYSSHTLRKTWAYQQRISNGAKVELLQTAFGHSTGRITLKYACVQDEELKALYMKDI